MKHLFTLLSAAFLAAPLSAQPFPTPELLTPELIQRLKPALELTPAQEAKMSAVLAEAREKGEPAAASMKERQRALQQMLRDPSSTADAAGALLTQVLASEGEVKQLQLRTLFALRDILTPEQRTKALQLNLSKPVAEHADLERSVRAKAGRLQAAVQSLGVGPTKAMTTRGHAIEALIRDGHWQAANTALDALIAEAGIDATDETANAPDFATHEPGETSVEGLKTRLESLKDRAQELVSIPKLRRLLKAKDALEAAKAAEDATALGRILTYGEKVLEGK